MTNLTRLRELLAAATPGPWHTCERYHNNMQTHSDYRDLSIIDGEYDLRIGDAELIVAMRNVLPELLVVVIQAERQSKAQPHDLPGALAALNKRLGAL